MVYIKSFEGQSWLLPPSIEELIPKDHVCFLVEELVCSLDFSSFDEKYVGAGRPAYHPRILLKLLVQGVLDRVRSSRRLARNSRENVVYMYLSEKLSPDFRTISDFRKDNPDLIKDAFKHTIGLAKSEGLLDLSHLATDGTKIKANASKNRVLTKEELGFLLSFVDDELEKWAEQDKLEDDYFGDVRGTDQLPEKSKKKMKKVVERYIKKLKDKGKIFKKELRGELVQAQMEVDENNLSKISTTDHQSRFMKSKKGRFELSYNPQITTDNNGFILASDVCNDSNDTHQLEAQVIQTEKNLKQLPERVKWSFDNGYYESVNIKFLADKNVDAYIPHHNEDEANPYHKRNFVYNSEKDEYICPESKPLLFRSEWFNPQRRKSARNYKGTSCTSCQKSIQCTKAKSGIRQIKRFPYEEERQELKQKMETKEAKKIYKLRKQMVEPTIGDLKENKGFIAFLTRSLETVKTEFKLACVASNIRRIITLRKKKANRTRNSEGSSIFNLGRMAYKI